MSRFLRQLETLGFILKLCTQLREVAVGHSRHLFLDMDSLRKVWTKERLVDRGDVTGQQQLETLNPRCRCWISNSPGVPHLSWFATLFFGNGRLWFLFIPVVCFNFGMSDSVSDLDNGSMSELLGQWTDGWSTDSRDEDDSNGLKEPLTEEGDSGPTNSEYEGWDGGGSNMHASVEHNGNSKNVMGKQFSSPNPYDCFCVVICKI
ncbi:hypothetical protein AHAS_Ahas16G0241000 [Arachis hypogaea]